MDIYKRYNILYFIILFYTLLITYMLHVLLYDCRIKEVKKERKMSAFKIETFKCNKITPFIIFILHFNTGIWHINASSLLNINGKSRIQYNT